VACVRRAALVQNFRSVSALPDGFSHTFRSVSALPDGCSHVVGPKKLSTHAQQQKGFPAL
jgi:hypothetical protein